MVFLDAIHDYEETKKDIEWARLVGAKIIAGHDYCDEFPGVKQIVDEMGGPARAGRHGVGAVARPLRRWQGLPTILRR